MPLFNAYKIMISDKVKIPQEAETISIIEPLPEVLFIGWPKGQMLVDKKDIVQLIMAKTAHPDEIPDGSLPRESFFEKTVMPDGCRQENIIIEQDKVIRQPVYSMNVILNDNGTGCR